MNLIFVSSQAYQSQYNSQSEVRIAVTPEDFEDTTNKEKNSMHRNKSTSSKPYLNKAECNKQEEKKEPGDLNTDDDINLEEIDDFLDEKRRVT